MARADRLEQADLRRGELEAEYRATLIAALEVCAGGKWGLFAHRKDKGEAARVAATIEELTDLDDAIAKLRDLLGLAPFTLHDTFMAARGTPAPSAVGEPKQARAWLERLAAES